MARRVLVSLHVHCVACTVRCTRCTPAVHLSHCLSGGATVDQALPARTGHHAAAAAGCPPFPGRRRPFLVKALENVLQKFVMGLEFYDDEGRHKIAIGERY